MIALCCGRISFLWIRCTVSHGIGTQTFLGVPREDIVVPLDDVTVSTVSPETSTTGGEGADDGHHPSERRTDGLTTQSPPVTTVDDADKYIQRSSYDGLNSMTLKNRLTRRHRWLSH